MTEANRAVAVAMAEGPATGLAILDSLGSRLARWPQFHIARAELLHRTGRTPEAIAAFRLALDLPLPQPEQAFLERRISELRNTRDGPGLALVHAGNAVLRVPGHRHLAVVRRRSWDWRTGNWTGNWPGNLTRRRSRCRRAPRWRRCPAGPPRDRLPPDHPLRRSRRRNTRRSSPRSPPLPCRTAPGWTTGCAMLPTLPALKPADVSAWDSWPASPGVPPPL